MKIQLTYHGKLSELLDKKSEILELNSKYANELQRELKNRYPALSSSTFQLAQSNRILSKNEELDEKNVDVFPPFSGG